MSDDDKKINIAKCMGSIYNCSVTVKITNCEGKILNSKAEFRQPPIVRVRREVNVGV